MGRRWHRVVAILVAAGGIVALFLTRGNSSAEPVVEETLATEPTAGVTGLTFPYTLPENGLILEGTESYSGAFVEDDSGDEVTGVTGLIVYNPCDRMVRFGAIALEQDGKQLYFFVYCLPPGGRCLILEKNRHPYVQQPLTQCRVLTMRWEYQDLHSEQIYYVGFGEELTVVNHSAKQLRHVALWYKRYDRKRDCFLGGVAYSAHVFRLHAQAKRVLMPLYYCAGEAKVVNVELEES